MPGGRARLVPVPEDARPAPARTAFRREARHAVWLLALALALAGLGWGMARREAGRLARELEATQTELRAARARLAAAESQRQTVRARLEALAAEASGFAGRLGELEALVRGDLEPANDPQPAGKVDASPD